MGGREGRGGEGRGGEGRGGEGRGGEGRGGEGRGGEGRGGEGREGRTICSYTHWTGGCGSPRSGRLDDKIPDATKLETLNADTLEKSPD